MGYFLESPLQTLPQLKVPLHHVIKISHKVGGWTRKLCAHKCCKGPVKKKRKLSQQPSRHVTWIVFFNHHGVDSCFLVFSLWIPLTPPPSYTTWSQTRFTSEYHSLTDAATTTGKMKTPPLPNWLSLCFLTHSIILDFDSILDLKKVSLIAIMYNISKLKILMLALREETRD